MQNKNRTPFIASYTQLYLVIDSHSPSYFCTTTVLNEGEVCDGRSGDGRSGVERNDGMSSALIHIIAL